MEAFEERLWLRIVIFIPVRATQGWRASARGKLPQLLTPREYKRGEGGWLQHGTRVVCEFSLPGASPHRQRQRDSEASGRAFGPASVNSSSLRSRKRPGHDTDRPIENGPSPRTQFQWLWRWHTPA